MLWNRWCIAVSCPCTLYVDTSIMLIRTNSLRTINHPDLHLETYNVSEWTYTQPSHLPRYFAFCCPPHFPVSSMGTAKFIYLLSTVTCHTVDPPCSICLCGLQTPLKTPFIVYIWSRRKMSTTSAKLSLTRICIIGLSEFCVHWGFNILSDWFSDLARCRLLGLARPSHTIYARQQNRTFGCLLSAGADFSAFSEGKNRYVYATRVLTVWNFKMLFRVIWDGSFYFLI